MSDSKNADAGDWEVVCVRCLRVKRSGLWTDEKAKSVKGVSTGLCSPCYDQEVHQLRQRGVLK